MCRTILFLLWCLVFGVGCAHNVPPTQQPQVVDRQAGTMKVWVDQDGTIYPDNWEAEIGRVPWKGGYSMKWRVKQRPEKQRILDRAKEDTLGKVASLVRDKKRVFILVHGYNNNAREADAAYCAIRQSIQPGPDDAVIEFHWDGLTGGGGLGPVRIWFSAAGYSQLAGMWGLRGILNQIERKEVFVIAHSRGASVLLSSLSDPHFVDGFECATSWLNFDAVPQLRENDNKIKVLMLAPAIGFIDFAARCDCATYRSFTPQLREVFYTVNGKDKVLKKFVGWLSPKFNDTSLGYIESGSARLRQNKHFSQTFHSHPVTDVSSHRFTAYVGAPSFRCLLEKLGIAPPCP